jgi:hypothetical protein
MTYWRLHYHLIWATFDREALRPNLRRYFMACRQLKSASSYAINHMEGSDGKFQRQEGCGALNIGKRSFTEYHLKLIIGAP